MKILLAEDEKELCSALSAILKHNNYSVDVVHDGASALSHALMTDYDGIILDIMMPEKSGLEVVSEIRKKRMTVPVLLLTAKSELEDVVAGLDAGADDYLTKPFAMSELLARLRAMTRRASGFSPDVLTFGNLTLNRSSYELSTPNGSVRLGNKEFQMTEYLMANPGTLISTEKFLERVWGYDTETEINVVWVYISYLRKKFREIGSNVEIKAARGTGYTLAVSESD